MKILILALFAIIPSLSFSNDYIERSVRFACTVTGYQETVSMPNGTRLPRELRGSYFIKETFLKKKLIDSKFESKNSFLEIKSIKTVIARDWQNRKASFAKVKFETLSSKEIKEILIKLGATLIPEKIKDLKFKTMLLGRGSHGNLIVYQAHFPFNTYDGLAYHLHFHCDQASY